MRDQIARLGHLRPYFLSLVNQIIKTSVNAADLTRKIFEHSFRQLSLTIDFELENLQGGKTLTLPLGYITGPFEFVGYESLDPGMIV